LKNPALWIGSEGKGFALKDRPNPVMSIFSRPYLFRKVAATQDLGFDEYGEDSQGPRGANLKSWVAAMSGGIFLRYGLEKTGMTSLGAGFISHTPLR